MKAIFKDLELKAKKKLFKAIVQGKIKTEDLKNIEEVVKLFSQRIPLIEFRVDEICTYTFCGIHVSKEEFERLEKLAKALGIET